MAKKIALITVLVIIASICAVTLVACGGGEDTDAKEYTVAVAKTANGSVTVSKAKAKAGDEITVTATPNENYVLVDGSLKANDKAILDGKFIMPKENVMIMAEFVLRKESDVHNIDNFWGYLKKGDKNFSFRYTFDMSEGERVAKSVTEILFTPTALMETYTNTQVGVEDAEIYNHYEWLDDDYMYEASTEDGKATRKIRKYADKYGFKMEELGIQDGCAEYFEPDGNKWKIKDDEILNYMELQGFRIEDEGIYELFENLRVEFTDKSTTMTAEVEMTIDGIKHWQRITYEVYDYNTTNVTVPENVLNADVTKDETKPPVIDGVSLDNFGEFMRNGNYTLTQEVTVSTGDHADRKVFNVVKDADKYIIRNQQMNEGTYCWLDGDYYYCADSDNSTITKKRYSASEWRESLETSIVLDVIAKDASKYFEELYSFWCIRPSMIDEYMAVMEKESGGKGTLPREAFERLQVYIEKDSISLRVSIEENGTTIEYRFIYSNFNKTTVEIPDGILNAEVTA